MSRVRLRKFRWVATGAGVAMLTALFVVLGPDQVLSLLGSLGPNFLVVMVLFVGHESLRALAVMRCLLRHERPPFTTLLRIRFMGEAVSALTSTGPFLAEPTRAWMLAQHGRQSAPAYGAAVSEFVINSCTSAVGAAFIVGIALEASALDRHLVPPAWVVIGIAVFYVTVTAVLVTTRTYLIGMALKALAALPRIGPRLATDPRRIRDIEDTVRHVFTERRAAFAQVVALEVLAQAMLMCEVYWAIRSMGLPISFVTAMRVEALTKVANVVQIIGVTEGGYAVVFNWLGLPATVGFTLSLIKRLRSLAVAAIGLGVLSARGRAVSRREALTDSAV